MKMAFKTFNMKIQQTQNPKKKKKRVGFDLQTKEKTVNVRVKFRLYGLAAFSRKNRPKGAGCILALIKKKSFKKDQYRLIVEPNATDEMINAALTMLILPF